MSENRSQSARVFLNTNTLCSLNKVERLVNDFISEESELRVSAITHMGCMLALAHHSD